MALARPDVGKDPPVCYDDLCEESHKEKNLLEEALHGASECRAEVSAPATSEPESGSTADAEPAAAVYLSLSPASSPLVLTFPPGGEERSPNLFPFPPVCPSGFPVN